jgi:hypothetical protein
MYYNVRGKLSAPEINLGVFNKKLQTVLVEQQVEAVKVWLKTVLSHIPTYTGTTRGTFAPLGRKVNYVFGATPTAAGRRKYVFIYPKGGRRYPLGFEEGRRYQDNDIYHFGSGNRIEYVFKFELSLPYAVWNDQYPAPQWLTLPSEPPWEAMAYAAVEFYRYVHNVIPKHLPDPNYKVKIKTIKVR